MFSVSSLLKFLFCTALFFENIALAEYVSHFIYHKFDETTLQLAQSAKIDRDGRLELTNISYQQIGRAFFPTPFKFNKSASFSTTFVFAIVPETPILGGHGFTFVISPSVNFPGALPVEWLGIFNETTNGMDSDHVFAVEFDTIKTVGFQDINNNHVGIDVNSLISNVSAPATHFSGMENKSLELISGKPMQAWIDYDDQDKFLSVTIAPSKSQKPERPLLSITIDLSSIFSDSMYVGFSSSTGSVASHHYILGWSFNTSGPAEKLDISKLPSTLFWTDEQMADMGLDEISLDPLQPASGAYFSNKEGIKRSLNLISGDPRSDIGLSFNGGVEEGETYRRNIDEEEEGLPL